MRRAKADAFCGSPTTLYHRISEIIPWAIFMGLIIYLVVRWRALPEQIPLHYDLAGNITGYGGKGNIIVLVVIAFIMNITMWLVGLFPQSWNAGVRITFTNRVWVYKCLRDMMADLRIAMSLLFPAMTITILEYDTAFSHWFFRGGIWCILVLVIIPMIRYFVRVGRVK